MSFLRHRRKHFRVVAGGWPDDDGYLYKDGDYEDEWVAGYTAGTTVTQGKAAGNLWITLNVTNVAEGTWVTDNTVYLTNSNKIKIEWQFSAASNLLAAIVISTSKSNSYATYTARVTKSDLELKQTTELALTGISAGNYYVRAHLVLTAKANVNKTLNIYKVYIE
jgi:hypothetical protein